MGIIRFTIWTATCVALGIGLATFEVGGHTPWQHAQHLWHGQSNRLDGVEAGARTFVDEVKKRVTAKEEPKERHSEEDRDAVNRIIAKRQK